MSRTPLPIRRSIRLRGYDYTLPGAYFVTICSHDRSHPFCSIDGRGLHRTWLGQIIANAWHRLPSHFPMVQVDAFVVMPDHVHGVLWVDDGPAPDRPLVGNIVRSFKAAATRRARQERLCGERLWHRNYFESVIRDREHLIAIRRYIANNPRRWWLTH